MKKITFLFTFLVFAFSYGQGLETFDNSTTELTASYADGSFVGNDGITWTFVHSRNEGDYPIEGPGIMLRRASDPSSLSATITGGIGDFSVDTRKAFTANAQRILELYINGNLIDTFEPDFADGADDTVIPFVVENIDVEGEFTLEIRVGGTGTTNRQITLDNLSWTAFPAGGGGNDPCLTWQSPTPTTGWNDFNTTFGGAPTPGSGCPFNELTAFEVWASEAYNIQNFIEGVEYTFSICNGPGAGSWVPDFTIIAPSGAVDAFGLGDGDGCSITWTASESGTYLVVINEAGVCGGGTNTATDNGFPALTCTGSGEPSEGCLDAPNGQWPGTAYTPATCDGSNLVITTAAWTGEYSVVNVVDGFTYSFSSSVATDFVTISDAVGNVVLAYGTESVTWDADFDGQVRFYLHLSDNCDSSTASRSRIVSCEETTTGGGDGCLDAPNGQWPSAAYTPATCDGVTVNTITAAAWTGEYSVVNVVDGFSYTFSSSVSTDLVTISDVDGTIVLASGISSVEWEADFDGQIRFYLHLNEDCDSSTAGRSRLVVCEEGTGGGTDGCLDAPNGQWPSAAYTPATCDGVTVNTITAAAWTGEYSVVNVVDGFSYIFSSSVSTDLVTISDVDGSIVLASGISSVEWEADFDGQIRFYLHLNEDCDSSTAGRSRLVVCEEGTGGGGNNWECEDAIALECGDVVTGTTTGASNSGGNPAPDVFYSYTGNGEVEFVTISLCDGGTNYDSLLRVYSDCSLTNQIAVNDDFCGLQSQLTFESDGVSTYYIMVEGFGSAAGNYSLAITCELPPAPPACGGIFTDSGGVDGNYSNNEDITWTITPDEEGDYVSVIFTAFDVEANWDALYVFDGPDTSSPQISSGNPATLSGFPAGGFYGTTIPGPFESTHESGALTFRFLSDGSVTRPGWVADVVCLPAPPPNDLIENAISVTNETQPYTDAAVRLQFATNELLNPDGCAIAGTNGVWYSFTAAFDGSAEASITTPSGTSAVIFFEAPNENVTAETDLTFNYYWQNQCAPGTESSIPTVAGQSYYIFVLNTGGASDVVIDISESLSVVENTIDGFTFYPNPASTVLNVQANTSIDNIELYTMVGQRVIAENINAMSSQIDISGIATGVYLMKVTSGDLTATYQVIKR